MSNPVPDGPSGPPAAPLPPPPPPPPVAEAPRPRPWWDKRRSGAPPAPAGWTPPPPPVGLTPPPDSRRGIPPRWGIGDVFISLGIIFGVQVVVVTILGVVFGPDAISDPSPGMTIALLLLTWATLLPWPIAVMFMYGSGRPDLDFGLAFKPMDALWGFAGWIAFLLISGAATLIFYAFGGEETPTNTDIVDTDHLTGIGVVVLAIMIAVITPVVEELWFRGFLLRAVGKRYGAPIAIVVSSLVFGAFHLQGNGWEDLYVIGLLAAFGAVLAVLVVKNEGRLGPAIVAHALNNGVTVLILLNGVIR